MEKYKLIDNKERRQYEFHIDGYVSKIDYIISGNGDIFLTHTEVPYEQEGKGIGSQLVDAVLRDIDNKNQQVVPLCGFVASYIKKHPEWKHLVIEGVYV